MRPNSTTPLRRYIVHDRNRVEGWLSRIDAEILYTIANTQAEKHLRGAVVEIGLHHGKLFIALCLALQDAEQAYGIDLFDNQKLNVDSSGSGNRSILESNLSTFGVDSSKVVLDARSSEEVKAADVQAAVGKARIFSVDGGHWLEIVENDLRLAEECIADHGVIALDDFHRPEWPDVSAGYLTWYGNRTKPIVPFAIGFNKLFLCQETWVEFYQRSLQDNPLLVHFLTKRYKFQGQLVPVYNALVLPEAPALQRFHGFLKFHNTDLYLRLRLHALRNRLR
jgi:hypothetical protein